MGMLHAACMFEDQFMKYSFLWEPYILKYIERFNADKTGLIELNNHVRVSYSTICQNKTGEPWCVIF